MKFITVLIAGLTLSVNVDSADIAAGKAKSVMCAACHGKAGISMIPVYPNLAGQKAQYTALQLKAFRDGLRKNMQMSSLAKSLSDEDIENLAAYYASLPIKPQ
ncbi:MAG: cytochrome c [Kangiellaceae bacterium]|nr:cytochrome c [Kangiellaceae bacterium]